MKGAELRATSIRVLDRSVCALSNEARDSRSERFAAKGRWRASVLAAERRLGLCSRVGEMSRVPEIRKRGGLVLVEAA
jgi:hypothetical protein